MATFGPSVNEGDPAGPADRPTGLVVIDAQGVVQAWSRSAEHLVGYTSAQAVGRSLKELVDLPPPAAAGSGTVEESHRVLPVRCRDGRLLTLPVSGYPLVSDHAPQGWVLLLGPPPGPLGGEEREALVEWLLNRSGTALTVYDADLRCVCQSAAMRGITGVPDDLRRGRTLGEVVQGASVAGWEQRMRRVLETGEEEICFDFRATPPTVSRTHVYTVTTAPLRDALGRTLGVCTTVGDVTEERLARERLSLLNEAGARIGSTLDLVRTAQELTEVAVPGFADFARVDLLEGLLRGDEPAPGPIPGAVRLRRIAERVWFEGAFEEVAVAGDADVYLASSPAALCLASGRSALYRTSDPAVSAWIAASPARQAKVSRYGTHSWILVPVRARGTTLGVVMCTRTRDTPDPFEPEDLALAEELVSRAAVCLDNARRFTRERTAALALQRSLLPQGLLQPSAAVVASRYLPASHRTGVGGDWFDVIELSGARVGLVVGDVVGHGIHAAAAMGRLRTAVRALADVDPTPEELLTRLDDLVIRLSAESAGSVSADLAHDSDADAGAGIEATCLYAVYDPVSGHCSMARAGHPAPVLVGSDGAVSFVDLPAGPPLGLGGLPFESADLDLPEQSVLALYTDGLVESRQRDIGQGLDILCRTLGAPADSLEELCDRVVEALLPVRPSDDAALLLVRPRPLGPEQVAVWNISPDPAAVARARAETLRKLGSWGLEEASFVTELVVSELVTNAIRYADTPIELRLITPQSSATPGSASPRVLICEVSDSSSTAPHLRRARAFDEGGRGLLLVAHLTDRWGTRQTTTGKTIWCEQVLPAATLSSH
ncbi:SpoIIE family protein phosphatase [Streptomyces heilongjiangensis]|uniref:SpoIIE family protein phosphatase n=1 Tax=Streptomyces heilongjiangensis TaxID=945052 RepID=A0ABW1BEE4_9ACTN|nr:SpoIIE family protein phosphatase [Streptomyces heilongjiangensis]MDC2949786.1 SpoIIE family protein phosphatase [Streptomyces heilongjiangensis]